MRISNSMVNALYKAAKGYPPRYSPTLRALQSRGLLDSRGSLTKAGQVFLYGYRRGQGADEGAAQRLREELAVLREVNANLHRQLRQMF